MKTFSSRTVTVVKTGGAILEDQKQIAQLLDGFCRLSNPKVLVHGGGRTATRIATQLGVESRMIDGRRITGKEMLDVVTMVYGGLTNKNLVAALQARQCNALGLTGADLNLIAARRRPPVPVDYGFVGDVEAVNAGMLAALLEMEIVPIIAPLTHDNQGALLNTNADTIASSVACALARLAMVNLIFLFEKPGVLADATDEGSLLPSLNNSLYQELKVSKQVHSGMIPKLDNCFNALRAGVNSVRITGSFELTGGTTIRL